MNKKKDCYYQQSLDIIASLKEKKSLAMHTCCAPCATFPLEFLYQHFDLTLIYYNPNIYPQEEYNRRLDELKRYMDIFNKEHKIDIRIVELEPDFEEFNKKLQAFGPMEEGKQRCQACYFTRMNKCYQYAVEQEFDYFTSVMTISRQKNSVYINKIGEQLEKEGGVAYLYSDFKKHQGIDQSILIRKKYNLYNQEYCGCFYSYSNYLKKSK